MAEETKKVSLADAAKAMLAAKQAKGKQAQAGGGFGAGGNQPKAMQSQNTKKVNNQRKRMGV